MEAARVAEGLTVKQAMKLLGLSRTSYYRQVRGVTDYRKRAREVASAKHKGVWREVALTRVEAGHRRVRAYALAWGQLSQEAAGSSRMSCYRVLKSEGLIQPKRIGHDLRITGDVLPQSGLAGERGGVRLQTTPTAASASA